MPPPIRSGIKFFTTHFRLNRAEETDTNTAAEQCFTESF
jgi:hypothetical protein